MKLEDAKIEISNKTRQYEQFKEMHSSSTNINQLKQQIEEERSKFAQIMTNWSQEVTQTIYNSDSVLYSIVFKLYYNKLLNIFELYFRIFC